MLDTRPLRSLTFRHLAAAYSVNELGNWIGDVALAILVFDRTGSPLATAALFLALRFLPSLLAPLLTTRVEALPARKIVPALYAGEAAIFAALALAAGRAWLPVVLALTALDGMLAIAAKTLTRSATVASLMPSGLLRQGNALLNLAFSAGGAAGPAVAGAVVAAGGPSAALWLDAASFAAAAVALATARALHVHTDRAATAAGRLRAGLREIRDRPGVLRIVVALAFALLFSSVAVPIEVVFAKRTLHAGDGGYGLLLGAWGVGMIGGGAAFAAAGRVRVGPLLVASASVIALGYGGLAAAPDLAVACAFSAVGGIGNGAGSVASIQAIQQALALERQSAVMAVVESLNQVMPALGFVLGGAVTALGSPRTAYLVSALGVATVVAVVGLQRLQRRPQSTAAPGPVKEIA